MSEIKHTDQPSHQAVPNDGGPRQTASEQIGCFAYGVIYVAIAYLGALFIVYAGLIWLIRSSVEALGENWPWWLTAVILSVVWAAAAIPVAPWLYFWRSGRLRNVAKLWGAGSVYLLLQIPLHLIPVTEVLWWHLAQLLLNGTLAVVIGFLFFQRGLLARPAGPYTPSLFLAIILGLPWVIFGAYGGFLEILVISSAALSFGLLAAILLVGLGKPSGEQESDVTWNNGTGAHIAGTLLLFMALGFGASLLQMALLFVLSLAGWIFMSLLHWGRERPSTGWLAGGLFLGIVTALPLLTFDVAELEVSLGFGLSGLWQWLGISLGTFLIIALLLSIAFFFLRFRLVLWGGMGIASGVVLLLSIGLWAGIGQPGTHGERLFVILENQHEVASAMRLDDIIERRRYVYGTLTAHAETTQADLRSMLDLLQIDYQPYYLVNAIEVEAGPLVRLWLLSRPEVDRVLLSPRLRPLPLEPLVVEGELERPAGVIWNLKMIGADRVWETYDVRGEGITIGQSDSGVAWQHPELVRSYRGGAGEHDFNWLDPWFETWEPEDWSGHGTHTLGTVLGENVGVAPEATWFGCTNLGRNLGNAALYLDCMQFMLAPYPLAGDPFVDGDVTLAADVLNNSWGCPPVEGCDPNALLPAVEAMRAAGIFVVASAGNSGPGCGSVDSPLPLYENAFAVGAVDARGELTEFSSRGPVSVDGSARLKPDILAPGRGVLSAMPRGSYAEFQGTSMAGPHVAGVVALIWSANPDLIGQIDETAEIIRQTAAPYDFARLSIPPCADSVSIPNPAVGYGIVDAFAAVTAAMER